MTDPNEPQRRDAVLGGDRPSPPEAIVLGGMAGVLQRFATGDAMQRQRALRQSTAYGSDGIDLAIRGLGDESAEVQRVACELLRAFLDDPHARQRDLYGYLRARKAMALFPPSGINYTPLQACLERQAWQEADRLTTQILLRLAGLGRDRKLLAEHVRDIPCEDLLLLDRLWEGASRGRFGFSAQRRIWEPLRRGYWDEARIWSIFGDRVGWRTSNFLLGTYRWKRYEELAFDLSAPVGHLPYVSGIFTASALCDRLHQC